MIEILVEMFLFFAKLGLASFGAASAVLGEMQAGSVAKGWVTELSFIQAYAVSQLTPGPQYLFVAILGYNAMGLVGSITAVMGFFFPSGMLTLALTPFWSRASQSPWPDALRRAVGPVAIGLMASGIWAIAPAGLNTWWARAVGVAALAWMLAPKGPGPLPVVLSGAALGALTTLFPSVP